MPERGAPAQFDSIRNKDELILVLSHPRNARLQAFIRRRSRGREPRSLRDAVDYLFSNAGSGPLSGVHFVIRRPRDGWKWSDDESVRALEAWELLVLLCRIWRGWSMLGKCTVGAVSNPWPGPSSRGACRNIPSRERQRWAARVWGSREARNRIWGKQWQEAADAAGIVLARVFWGEIPPRPAESQKAEWAYMASELALRASAGQDLERILQHASRALERFSERPRGNWRQGLIALVGVVGIAATAVTGGMLSPALGAVVGAGVGTATRVASGALAEGAQPDEKELLSTERLSALQWRPYHHGALAPDHRLNVYWFTDGRQLLAWNGNTWTDATRPVQEANA